MRIRLALLMCTVATTVGLASEPARVAPEDFIVLAWRVGSTEQQLRAAYDCGFNVVGPVLAKDLSAVKSAGLKAIVFPADEQLGGQPVDFQQIQTAEQFKLLLEPTLQNSATFGVLLRDEPTADLFAEIGRQVKMFQTADAQPQPLVNLFPNYAMPAQLGTDTYREYLERFVEQVQPPLISYDHYALMDDGSVRGGYFENLEDVRRTALLHDLPFMQIVLANAHFNYADPTDAGLRFQAYTTLAYGARGIGYFTYQAPERGNYRASPIDQFGNKTATWPMLQNVNLQVQTLALTLRHLHSVNVFHHPSVPPGCKSLEDSEFMASLTGTGPFVVGEFSSESRVPYVLVVNRHLTKSCQFDLQFRDAGKILHINSYDGQVRPWEGESKWLAPGQGMLLYLEK